jgi:transcriptional regulator GlxA family with amidase domain
MANLLARRGGKQFARGVAEKFPVALKRNGEYPLRHQSDAQSMSSVDEISFNLKG